MAIYAAGTLKLYILVNPAQYGFGQYRFSKSFIERSFWVPFIDRIYPKEADFVQYANNLRVHINCIVWGLPAM
jgi:hypothetical protein